MSLLAPCYPWWRYPVKPPNSRSLDHTKLQGNRAVYPVRRFSKAQCAAYIPEKAKEGHRGRLKEKVRKCKRWSGSKRDSRRDVTARKLRSPHRHVDFPRSR